MIEFKGNLTGTSQEYALKKNAGLTQRFLALGGLCLIPSSYVISVTVLHNFWIFILPVLFLVAAVITGITYKKHTQQLPTCICIDGGTIEVGFKFNVVTLDISKVKAVYDRGDFYEIIPKNVFNFSVFICQKDLLTEGTLEEFETLFDGKIVKK